MVIDAATLISILVGLFFLDRSIAFSSIAVFGFLCTGLYIYFRTRAKTSGRLERELYIQGSQSLLEVLGSFRETYVRNRGHFYAKNIGKTRLALAETQASLNLMKIYSKYIMDISVTLGALSVAVLEFYFVGGSGAIASLGLFLAAGAKLAPAVLRLQQNALDLKSGLAGSEPTLVLYEKLLRCSESKESQPFSVNGYPELAATVEFSNICFAYPESEKEILSDVSFEIMDGQYCAIMGTSGAGKTTLVDIMLGLIKPSAGTVLISGVSPSVAINR
jgi:ABC-type transport system involved in cytochrome bd biosynthesis fused ATPase/permease subunit